MTFEEQVRQMYSQFEALEAELAYHHDKCPACHKFHQTKRPSPADFVKLDQEMRLAIAWEIALEHMNIINQLSVHHQAHCNLETQMGIHHDGGYFRRIYDEEICTTHGFEPGKDCTIHGSIWFEFLIKLAKKLDSQTPPN
jgi:hypothetical protein